MQNPQKATIVPSHGRGRLLAGGKFGNRGGPGRPPCAIKAACRTSFAKALATASKIAIGETPTLEGSKPTNSDMIRAINVLGRYGFYENDTVLPAQLLEVMGKVLADHIAPERLQAAIDSLVNRLEECPDPEK